MCLSTYQLFRHYDQHCQRSMTIGVHVMFQVSSVRLTKYRSLRRRCGSNDTEQRIHRVRVCNLPHGAVAIRTIEVFDTMALTGNSDTASTNRVHG